MQNAGSALFLVLWSSLCLPVPHTGLNSLLGSVTNFSLTRGLRFSSFLIAQLMCSGSHVCGSIAICDLGGYTEAHRGVGISDRVWAPIGLTNFIWLLHNKHVSDLRSFIGKPLLLICSYSGCILTSATGRVWPNHNLSFPNINIAVKIFSVLWRNPLTNKCISGLILGAAEHPWRPLNLVRGAGAVHPAASPAEWQAIRKHTEEKSCKL